MDTHELLMTALRALGVYVLMLVVIRVLGKRTVGNFSAFDLLVALMLGEIVDELIYGDVSFLQGVVAIGVIALAEYGTNWLSYFDHGMNAILEGTPAVIVKNGEFQHNVMRRERMNRTDVLAALRLQGIDDVREVKLATVETDGEVSVIQEEWAEPVQKSDLGGDHARKRKAALNGTEEPPPEKRTDPQQASGGK
jgi:uncharacterized membrane protein YcaP (DUF421 family)